MLKPLPNLDDSAAMQREGAAYVLWRAKRDAVLLLRDVLTRLQGHHPDYESEIAAGRAALDRIEEILRLERVKTKRS